MKKNIVLMLMLPAIAFIGMAQSVQQVIPGKTGVYCRVTFPAANEHENLSQKFDKCIIQQSSDGVKFEDWFTITKPANYSEFEKRVGKDAAENYKKYAKAKSDEDMMQMIQSFSDTLGFLYFDKNFLQGIGLLGYKEFGKSKPVAYKAINILKDGTKQEAYTVQAKDISETIFGKLSVQKTKTTDSAVQIIWTEKGGNSGTYAAKVFRRTGTTGKFEELKEKILKVNDTLNIGKFAFAAAGVPGTFYSYYLVPIDFADNESNTTSDTANVLTVANKQMQGIQNLNAKDTLSTILLTWKQLPQQGYYSGIQILKSRSAMNEYVAVDTVDASAVSYRDRNIIPGVYYYYQVQAIMYPFAGIMKIASSKVGASVKNSQKPFAPQGLRAVNEGKNIRLNWAMSPELDLYAFYVLRGTNAHNMVVVANKVQDTTWVDSSVNLSGQTSYAYALQVMNLQQKLSDTSAPIFIKPARSVALPDVGGLTSNVNGNKVQLRWENVAARNSMVTGYLVLRREKDGDKFFVINRKIIPAAFFTDTLTDKKGTVYEYAVACMDVNGNVSNMSNSVFASASGAKPIPPAKVYAVQMQENINISWSAVAVNDSAAVSYIVYRNPAFPLLICEKPSLPKYHICMAIVFLPFFNQGAISTSS
jgi:hypothetical protein